MVAIPGFAEVRFKGTRKAYFTWPPDAEDFAGLSLYFPTNGSAPAAYGTATSVRARANAFIVLS